MKTVLHIELLENSSLVTRKQACEVSPRLRPEYFSRNEKYKKLVKRYPVFVQDENGNMIKIGNSEFVKIADLLNL